MTERTLDIMTDNAEYMTLKRAADIMTAMESNPAIYYKVGDCYLDLGSNWMWTTILAVNTEETGVLRSWQAIDSRQWKDILATNTKQELLEVMKNIIK